MYEIKPNQLFENSIPGSKKSVKKFYRVNINLKLTPKLVDDTGNEEEISGELICLS